MRAIKSLFRFYSHFGAGFVVGCVYVSLLLTVPRLLQFALKVSGE